jgi:hypothetical protein
MNFMGVGSAVLRLGEDIVFADPSRIRAEGNGSLVYERVRECNTRKSRV